MSLGEDRPIRLGGSNRPFFAIMTVIVIGMIGSLGLLAINDARADVTTFLIDGVPYAIEIEPEHVGGYDRSDWPHWSQGVGAGCFTVRDKVLVEESVWPVLTEMEPGSARCRVISGVWHGPFTGEILASASDIDVDHLVPLKEAHESGGHAWDRDRRRAYANALKSSEHLVAVSASANRAKGARDPAEWLPAPAYQCDYAAAWVRVKQRWQLSMDQAEADVVTTILGEC